MKIRDIVNRDLVNLANCESEPIHIPGSIQPHGFLLGLDPQDHTIVFCSANIREFTDLAHTNVLGEKIDLFLDNETLGSFQAYLSRPFNYSEAHFSAILGGKRFECLSHHNGSFLILEFEPSSQDASHSEALYFQARQFIQNIEHTLSLQGLCQHVADEIRGITGYDRVMVYRFDEQYNGEIFAESLTENIEPFLGLHYPHTDIPPQARELYVKNLLRLIVDMNYTPVPVYTMHENADINLDMSHTGLRSVSPIHVQYLQNMGVGATLTISLIHNEKLWGLIACHHYSPKPLNHITKVSAKLQGHFLASQIRVRELNEEYAVAKIVDVKLQQLIMENTQINRESLDQLVAHPNLRDICHASGVAICINNHIYKSGQVPADRNILDLVNWHHKVHSGDSFYTDKLSDVYDKGEAISGPASGVMIESLGSNRNAIIWFRHETEKEVHWAGDPQKAILKDEHGLHPRKSFSLWKEIVKGRSLPWLKPEINAAENFTHFLQRQLHLLFITEEEVKYRELSVKLQDANSELENINWISSHDLNEPLRKIQIQASRLLEGETNLPENVVRGISKMTDAAKRMQTLVADLLSYSRVSKMNDAMELTDLNAVLATVMEDLKEDIQELHATIHIDKLPTIKSVSFLIVQVFLNLMRNSLKFRKKDLAPVIEVRVSSEPEQRNDVAHGRLFHKITVSDNGIGFDNEFSKSIFDVFTRLHNLEKYSGSGVGLALSRKIIQNHGGFIEAHGESGVGAKFTLWFPVVRP